MDICDPWGTGLRVTGRRFGWETRGAAGCAPYQALSLYAHDAHPLTFPPPHPAAAQGTVSKDLSEEFSSLLLQIADATLEIFDVRHKVHLEALCGIAVHCRQGHAEQ